VVARYPTQLDQPSSTCLIISLNNCIFITFLSLKFLGPIVQQLRLFAGLVVLLLSVLFQRLLPFGLIASCSLPARSAMPLFFVLLNNFPLALLHDASFLPC